MSYNSPDIDTFKADLDNNITAIQKLKTDSHATIKIQSLLNITVYVLATRFLEGSIKHIIYNCCVMRGDNQLSLSSLDIELKKFNNPEYKNIKELFMSHLDFDVHQGILSNRFTDTDITLVNEIVRNRHKNVHASFDSSEWYNTNLKDITNNFLREYEGLLNILTYLDCIKYDQNSRNFKA